MGVGDTADHAADSGAPVDSGAADTPVDPGPGDPGADAPSGGAMTFVVVDGHGPAPLSGATVALDLPGGGRVERTTGADGMVTFDGIDWSAGTAAVSAHKSGYGIGTVVGLTEDWTAGWLTFDGTPCIYLWQLSPAAPETVTVSGSATGLLDASHQLIVNTQLSQVATEWIGDPAGTYAVKAPKGVPFALLGIEATPGEELPSTQGHDLPVHQVLWVEVDALEGDATLDLDFTASAVATKTVDGAMTLPTRAESPLRTGWPNCWVFNNGSTYASGWSSPVDISADGNQFDVTFVWVETGPPDSVFTFYRVRDPGTGELSTARVPGYPVAGALDPPLLDVPAWTTPGPTDLHPLHDPVSWQLFDDVSTAGLRIYKDETVLVWRIAAAGNATTVTVPEPPSSVDVATHLGTAPLKARVWAVIEDDDRIGWRYSLSSKVRLVP